MYYTIHYTYSNKVVGILIEIYLLEALKAFHDTGTLSAAAEQLHLAEPSVSRAMKKLERILEVSLFDRGKNKIVLNETGKLAVEYATRILKEEEIMVKQIRLFDKSLHSISLGSCAPGPIMELLPLMTGIFSDRSITSDSKTEEQLVDGLHRGEYDLILLNKPIMTDEYYCTLYGTEQLYLSVNPIHPVATKKTVTFSEMDGQRFIMFNKVGFWENIVKVKMPNSKFYKQEDLDAVSELASKSNLPSFSTDITQRVIPSRRNGRVNIPFSDPEAFAQYYLICKKNKKKNYLDLFERLSNA